MGQPRGMTIHLCIWSILHRCRGWSWIIFSPSPSGNAVGSMLVSCVASFIFFFAHFVQLEVRELTNDFANSRYKMCLQYLANLKGELQLDLHLHRHLDVLYKMVEDKCLMQWVTVLVSTFFMSNYLLICVLLFFYSVFVYLFVQYEVIFHLSTKHFLSFSYLLICFFIYFHFMPGGGCKFGRATKVFLRYIHCVVSYHTILHEMIFWCVRVCFLFFRAFLVLMCPSFISDWNSCSRM